MTSNFTMDCLCKEEISVRVDATTDSFDEPGSFDYEIHNHDCEFLESDELFNLIQSQFVTQDDEPDFDYDYDYE